ncbi:hypothetical protein F3087_27460 [Nocardia colli]|uniref:ABC transporter substrate-binding protein n=1 Tax=Nocardia colli TaxID=2545717 RepID=A0A5N0ED72_9NOCA|nr:hypothetical protein [Nocardia colli]KAA8885391.1 hypothetical protein F3087_27460 [Nocardia colli]
MVSLQRTIRLGATAGVMMALAFAAGCSTEPASVAGSPSAAVPPVAAGTAVTRLVADQVAILGPVGYDGIDLGMTVAQARNSGKIAGIEGSDEGLGCRSFTTRAGWSGYINEGKVVSIIPETVPRTPEGITAGSTAADVRAAYPDLKLGVNWSSATVPGHPANRYGFMGIRQSDAATPQAVTALLLFAADTNVCHN